MFHTPPVDRQGAYQRTDENNGGSNEAEAGATAVPASAAGAADATITKTSCDASTHQICIPNCNEDEKAWIQNFQQEQRRVTMESIALDRSKDLDQHTAADLLKDIYRIKEVGARTWAYYQNKMRAKHRVQAHLQMKPKWQEIDLLLEQAIYRLSTRYPHLVDSGADADDEVQQVPFVPLPGAQTGARPKEIPVLSLTEPVQGPEQSAAGGQPPPLAASPTKGDPSAAARNKRAPAPVSPPQTRSRTAAAAARLNEGGSAASATTQPPGVATTTSAVVISSSTQGPPLLQFSATAAGGTATGAGPVGGGRIIPPAQFIRQNLIPPTVFTSPIPFPSGIATPNVRQATNLGPIPAVVGASSFSAVIGPPIPAFQPHAQQLQLQQQQQQQHQNDQLRLEKELRKMKLDLDEQKRAVSNARHDVAQQVQNIQAAAAREREVLKEQHDKQIQDLQKQLEHAHDVYRQLEQQQQRSHGMSSSFRPEEQRQSTPEHRKRSQDVRFDHLYQDGVYRGRQGATVGRPGGGNQFHNDNPSQQMYDHTPQTHQNAHYFPQQREDPSTDRHRQARQQPQEDPPPPPRPGSNQQGQQQQRGGQQNNSRAIPSSHLQGVSTPGGAPTGRGHHHPVIDRFAKLIPNYGQREVLDPYVVPEQDERPEWYRNNLPPPWDKPPAADSTLITEPKKLEQLVTVFSGRKGDYSVWMTGFVANIHRARASVGIKAKCLIKALNKQDEMLRELLATLSADRDSYARAIHKLTDWYSHPRGVLASKLHRLNEIQNIKADDLIKLQKFHLRLEDYCDTAASMGRADDLVALRTYEENLDRLDMELRRDFLKWVRAVGARRDVPSMLAWLGELVKDARESAEALEWEKKGKKVEEVVLFTKNKKEEECSMCKKEHKLALCPAFLDLTPTQRRRRLEEWKRCYCCLESGHQIKECTSGVVCPTCERKHHHLLHGSLRRRRVMSRQRALHADAAEGEEAESEAGDDEWSEDSAVEEHVLKTTTRKSGVSLQTLPIFVQNPETRRSIKMNLLIDPGSTGAFLSKEAAGELRLTGRTVETTVSGFGGAEKTERTLAAAVQVSSVESPHKKHWVYLHVTDNPAGNYKPTDWTKKKEDYEHLRDLPVRAPVPGRQVDIMIGMANPELVCSLVADRTGKNKRDPMARLTRLGWVVAGPMKGTSLQPAAYFTSASTPVWETMPLGDSRKMEQDDLHRRVEKMWEIDTQINREKYSPVEEKIMQLLREKLELQGGKYELPTLWKNDARPANNFAFVKKRLEALKSSKHFRDAKLREEFMNNLQEWLEEDHVERVITHSPAEDKAYYLATFPVVRRDKTTTQVRPVMDGKAKMGKTKALNEFLYKGPKLINELTEVFLRFRLRRVAVAADVKKMFYQIKLAAEDRDWHRFLWPDDGPAGYEIYRWKVHPFGSAASPCIAIYTIKEHARRLKEEFPRAAEMVIHSTLVDDNLDSVDTVEEAVQLIKDAQQLYARAGMKLRKIISSSADVLKEFPAEERSPTLDLASFCVKDEFVPLVKTLGVIYLCEKDQFSFHMETPRVKKWTKREILSFEAQLYDPHGFVSPYIIVSRMILQQLWRMGLGWDEELPAEVARQWEKWAGELELLPQLRIDRCLTGGAVEEAELHVFCDASGRGYAAVAYLVTGKTGRRYARLVMSKAKVAPIKQLSIPRLELMAALLGVELAEKIYVALSLPRDKVHYYTDSTNVLCWIRSDSQDYNSFTGTRVAKIQTATSKGSWRWTDTDHNPADLPSRGCSLEKLLECRMWWEGPAFLARGEFPPQPAALSPSDDVLKELKKQAQFAFQAVVTPPLEDGDAGGEEWFPIKAGDWLRLLRVTAWVLRWRRPGKGPLLIRELRAAEVVVIKAIQKSAFKRSIEDLKRHGELSNKSHLVKLPPFFDNDGCLRLAGRLRDADWLEFEERHPLLLPKKHPATTALIRYYHEQVLNHAGPQHTLSVLIRRFWIVNGTTAVRKVITACVECRRRKAQPSQQIQASLPDSRLLQPNFYPFQKTALDMAGPFRVKYQDVRGERKRYVLLLTCMVCRALHLEEMQDTSAASFLAAFDRFVARRGVPVSVLSDNGSNFVAGLNELKLLWTEENLNEVKDKLYNIEWDFTPPKGPHFGGVYERLVRAVKQTLYHTCPAAEVIPWEQFHTGLVVAEGILNSRPLTYKTGDAQDPSPITPADLMAVPLYKPLAGAPWGWNMRKKWHQLQKRLDHLWSRLQYELQPYLQELTAWRSKKRALQVGDVVALMDEKRRGRWPLGRIMKTEVSHDGQVRKVHVLSAGTTYRRPISQVALLLEADEDESHAVAAEATAGPHL